MTPHKRSGFTLIELLVVIVIIAILATLGLVAYTQSLQSARNSRRISDIQSMSKALEQFYTANGGSYPGSNWNSTSATGINNSTYFSTGSLPRDPVSSSVYTPATTTTSAYCVCALLDGGTVRGGNSSNNNCTSWTNTGSGAYYCIKNQQ